MRLRNRRASVVAVDNSTPESVLRAMGFQPHEHGYWNRSSDRLVVRLYDDRRAFVSWSSDDDQERVEHHIARVTGPKLEMVIAHTITDSEALIQMQEYTTRTAHDTWLAA